MNKHIKPIILYAVAFLIIFISEDTFGIDREYDVPYIISEGMEAYKKDDAKSAISTWLGRGHFENSKLALIKPTEQLKKIESIYGLFKAYHIVFVNEPSISTKFIYVVMDYEKGPAFARFVTFKTEREWHVVRLSFDLEAESVWPAYIFLEETKRY
jgi:hypothetical protein